MTLYALDADGHPLPAALRLVRINALPVAPPGEQLSTREREVLVLIAAGVSYAAAADALFISERTFRSHANAINVKLACRNAVQSAVYALAAGLITWPEIEVVWRRHVPHLVK